jgi:UDP-N-acetylmuramate--alanine ligase
MVAHILMAAEKDPTIMIGGYLPLLHAGHRVGKGDTILLESCEYCDSFLNFFPSLAVILNIEADHLDYFKDLYDVEKSFRKFAQLSTNGILANGDDPNTVETLKGLDYISFGFGDGNRIHAADVSNDWRRFDVICDGEKYCHFELPVHGHHNAINALAAAAVAWVMGIPGEAAAEGLATFHGAGRRMEYKGQFNGADIYDDYAHHPGELAATIDAVKTMGYKRVIFAFQPHTYTRTHALFDDFVEQLKRPDVVVLAEIYAARERNTIGISSRDLLEKVGKGYYCATLPEVTDMLKTLAQPGDVILTVGAGDIYRAGEALLK